MQCVGASRPSLKEQPKNQTHVLGLGKPSKAFKEFFLVTAAYTADLFFFFVEMLNLYIGLRQITGTLETELITGTGGSQKTFR